MKRSAVLDRFVSYTFDLFSKTVDDAQAAMASDILPAIFEKYQGYHIQIYLDVDNEKVTVEGGTVTDTFYIITARHPISNTCPSDIQTFIASRY